MFKGLSLKVKLFSGFGVLAFLCAILGFMGYYSVVNLTKEINDVGNVNLPSIYSLTRIEVAQSEIDSTENALLAKNLDAQARREVYPIFDEALKKAAEGRKTFEAMIENKEEEAMFKSFISAWDKWIRDHDEFVRLAKAYETSPTEELYNKMSHQALVINEVSFAEADKQLEGLIDDNVKGGVESVKEAMSDGSMFETLSILFAVGSVFFASFIGFFLAKSISDPISAAVATIRESSGQIASASEQVSSASQQLSEASSEQASSIEETSASLEEMTGMVTNTVQNAEKSTQIADTVKDVSLKGNEAMGELVRAIEEILASNEKIQALVKVIGEIGEKTAVIDEIVFQTKLLSFNASVEAERAGEHGRGFAVVAQEVGNLAQMSGKAAQEISSIVKESIKNAEAITSDNKKKVEEGGKLVTDNAKILQEISEYAKTVADNARQILNASKDQASGITQINKAMSQLDKATQENASTSEEAASSSEELSSQAENLNQIVEDLNSLVTGKNSSREGGYTNTAAQKSVHTLNDFKKAKKEKHEIKPKVVKAVKRPVVAINAALNSSDPAEEAGWEQL